MPETVAVRLFYMGSTDDALLVSPFSRGGGVWLPWSQVERPDDLPAKATPFTFNITRRFVDLKGLLFTAGT